LSHFFAITAQLMRRILVDHPRSHLAEKRGRGAYKLEDVIAMSQERSVDLLKLDESLAVSRGSLPGRLESLSKEFLPA
jgi:hypothetical protein